LNTKLAWLLLVLLSSTCILIGVILSIPERPEGYDYTHPDYATMQRGPDGMERHGPVIWLGLSFAVLQFCIFTCLIALSLNKQGRLRKFKKPLLAGLLLNVGVFSLIIIAYMIYARDGTGVLIGSFPRPTAVMLYGLGPVQIVFAIIYILYFDRAIFTTEDLEKFQQLVKERRQQMEGED
jgi:magnesium-transporting ATPase (P-type)